MSVQRYLLGVLALAVLVAGAGHLGWRVRRRFFPWLSGAQAALANVLLGLGILLGLCYLLGTVGQFRLVPILIGTIVLGAAGFAIRLPKREPARRPGVRKPDLVAGGLAIAVIATVVAQWGFRVGDAMDKGVRAADSLVYHLAYAEHFVQTGSLTDIYYTLADQPTPFYPRTMELLHGLGIELFGSDIASALVNFAVLGIMLLAAWSIGAERGAGPIAAALVAVLAGTPIMASTQAGGANVDLGSVAFVVASFAFLVATRPALHVLNSNRDAAALPAQLDDPALARVRLTRLLLLAGICAGFGIGAKISVLPMVGMLTIAVVFVYWPVLSARVLGWWLGGLLLAGSYWYLVNIANVGNPVPFTNLRVGPVALPAPDWSALAPIKATIADQASSPLAWSFIGNGLAVDLGRVWYLVLGVVVLGVVGTVVSRDRVLVMLGAVTALSLVAYVFTPYTGGGAPGIPIFFTQGVRYVFAALVCGVALVPMINRMSGRWAQRIVAILAVALLGLTYLPVRTAVSLFALTSAWPGGGGKLAVTVAIGTGALVVLGAIVFALTRSAPPVRRRALAGVSAVVVAAVAVAGWHVQNDYVQHREADGYGTSPAPIQQFMQSSYQFLRGVHGARIGYSGVLPGYPLVGPLGQNTATYLGLVTPHHGLTDITTCATWMDTLRQSRVGYVFIGNLGAAAQVGPSEAAQQKQIAWMMTAPGVVLKVKDSGVIAIPGGSGMPSFGGPPSAMPSGKPGGAKPGAPKYMTQAMAAPTQTAAVFQVDYQRLGGYSCGS